MKILDFTGSDDDFEVSDEEINIGISVKKGNKSFSTSSMRHSPS
jgi:putative lysine transport system substrate-binding protein